MVHPSSMVGSTVGQMFYRWHLLTHAFKAFSLLRTLPSE
jgi:hypothetical protein